MSLMRSIKLVLAIGLLAGALTFENAWPGFGVVPQPDLSVEAFALVALTILLLARAPSPSAAHRRLTAMAALLASLVVLHYVNVTVSALFGRPFNLFWDGRHLPRVLVMAATGNALPWVAGVAAGAIGALMVLFGICRWALATVSAVAVAGGRGPGTAAGIAGIAAAVAVFGAFGPQPQRDHVVTPLAYTYGKQLLFVAAVHTPGATERLLPPSPVFSGSVAALRGVDVMILFNESYGAAVFEDRELAAALQPARTRLQQALAATGRQVASAFVDSPTFGGGSWLAHAALLSGVDMREADHHELLLASRRPTLVQHFKAHGYRSVALMPGLQSAWPEGAFYGFDQLYDAQALEYNGPQFGFWRIPDQYSVGHMHRLESPVRPGTPRLIVFPTINTHLPFDPVPPLARDWQFARAGTFSQALSEDAVRESLARTADWTRLREPYVRSMDYALSWLSSYLRELAPRELLLIVIGDHQPAATVVGRDADRAVPVHVISSSAELIQRFVDTGFAAGLMPRRPAIGQMHELTPMLLRMFDGCIVPADTAGRSAACEPARVNVTGTRTGG